MINLIIQFSREIPRPMELVHSRPKKLQLWLANIHLLYLLFYLSLFLYLFIFNHIFFKNLNHCLIHRCSAPVVESEHPRGAVALSLHSLPHPLLSICRICSLHAGAGHYFQSLFLTGSGIRRSAMTRRAENNKLLLCFIPVRMRLESYLMRLESYLLNWTTQKETVFLSFIILHFKVSQFKFTPT